MKMGMGRQVATVKQIPAPIGGWNARDPLAIMRTTDAVILENAVPGSAGVALRDGWSTYATGLGTDVNSLLRYNPPNGLPQLFACAGTKIFDVSAIGAVGDPVVTGRVTDKCQSVNFGTPGGNFLIVDGGGIDAPLRYDPVNGWVAMSLVIEAGYQFPLTPSLLKAPCVFGSRLWFIEASSLRVWYLGVNQIASVAATLDSGGNPTDISNSARALDLSSQCQLGGSLVAIATWTRDGGTGLDDYLVFLTTAGEAIIYSGTDPNSPSSFQRVGVFRIPPPIGARCLEMAGADLVVLTQQGILPLSNIIPLALAQVEQKAITDKIKGAFQAAYLKQPSAFGWQMVQYPRGSLLIVNVPQSTGEMQQYVMNALTGAWCNFTNVPALCWSLSGDGIFFGMKGGRVGQYGVGTQDDGNPINATVLPAFSNFKNLSQKRFLLARPLYNSALGYRPPLVVKVDYDVEREPLSQVSIPAAGTPWGSPWGSPWGPRIGPFSQWQSVRGEGQTASVLIAISSRQPFRFDHCDITFEAGGLF